MTLHRDPKIAAANAAVHASPTVRSIANDLGVRLADVTGTGAGGRVSVDDVRAASGRAAGGRRTDTRTAVADVRAALAHDDARDQGWFDGPAAAADPAPAATSGATVLVDKEVLRDLVDRAEAGQQQDDSDGWFPRAG